MEDAMGAIERYYEMWNMKINPFSVISDERFFFLSESHREAMETISFAFKNGAPIVKVYGDPGTGKTTLLRYMDSKVSGSNIISRYIMVDPLMTPSSFFMEILGAFSKKPSLPKDQRRLIERTLVAIGRSGKNMIVFVDETQDMGDRLLSFIRSFIDTLSTRYPDRDFLFVLAGDSTLKDRLSGREFLALNQRSPYECHLKGLTKKEAYGYIRYRLKIAGYTGDDLFPPKICRMIWEFSQGNPRIMNMLAERALISAFVNGRDRVEKADVRFAVRDLPPSLLEERPKKGFFSVFKEAV